MHITKDYKEDLEPDLFLFCDNPLIEIKRACARNAWNPKKYVFSQRITCLFMGIKHFFKGMTKPLLYGIVAGKELAQAISPSSSLSISSGEHLKRSLSYAVCILTSPIGQAIKSHQAFLGVFQPKCYFQKQPYSLKLAFQEDELQVNPDVILRQIIDETDKPHQKCTNIQVECSEWSASSSNDVGGPGRLFTETLFAHLNDQFKLNASPLEAEEHRKTVLENAGKFLGLVERLDTRLPIGNIFDESFFQMIKIFQGKNVGADNRSNQSLDKIVKNFLPKEMQIKQPTEEDLKNFGYKILDDYLADRSVRMQATAQRVLDAQTLLKGYVATAGHKRLQRLLKKSPEKINDHFQSTYNKENFVKIFLKGVKQAPFTDHWKKGLSAWVNTKTGDELQNLARALSGSLTLPKKITFAAYDPDFGHTCLKRFFHISSCTQTITIPTPLEFEKVAALLNHSCSSSNNDFHL